MFYRKYYCTFVVLDPAVEGVWALILLLEGVVDVVSWLLVLNDDERLSLRDGWRWRVVCAMSAFKSVERRKK